jgi:hypothetical protein
VPASIVSLKLFVWGACPYTKSHCTPTRMPHKDTHEKSSNHTTLGILSQNSTFSEDGKIKCLSGNTRYKKFL